MYKTGSHRLRRCVLFGSPTSQILQSSVVYLSERVPKTGTSGTAAGNREIKYSREYGSIVCRRLDSICRYVALFRPDYGLDLSSSPRNLDLWSQYFPNQEPFRPSLELHPLMVSNDGGPALRIGVLNYSVKKRSRAGGNSYPRGAHSSLGTLDGIRKSGL